VGEYFAMVIKSAAPGAVFTNAVFGTTYNGGNGYGTVYEITPEGDEVVLYSFSNTPDGATLLAIWSFPAAPCME